MKKLTYLLTFFVLLYSAKPFYGQPTISVRAPAYNQSIPSSLPYELFVMPYTNACYLITAPELAALTGSNITAFGIHFFYGNYFTATGTMTVYLQNTGDVNYNKGGYFPSCISGMTNVYTGATSIAAIPSGSTDVNCPLGTPFNYTGGGLYVAFSWDSGVSSTPGALYSYGAEVASYGVIKGLYSQTSAINSMSVTSYRPTFVFEATNTATNELGIDALLAPGKFPESLHASQVIQANVRNKSINTLSNVQVSLSVSGASNFSLTQVIPSIAPGAVTTVSFAPYIPTTLGSSTMVVTIPADQNPANNQANWTQSVGCGEAGHGPPDGSYYEPLGYQGIVAGKFNFSNTAIMGQVRLAISSTGINDVVHGVLLDQAGTVLARTSTLTVVSGMVGTFQTFTFTPPQTLQANTDYYIGMVMPGPNLSTLGGVRRTDGVPAGKFGIIPLAGGTFSTRTGAYYGIEPVLTGSITISPSASVICYNDPHVLTPGGSSAYIWTNATGSILPTSASGSLEVSSLANASYFVSGTDAAGCSAQGSIVLNVVLCTGINEASALNSLSLYPNPTVNGRFDVGGLQPASTLAFYNMLGQELYIKTAQNETEKIELPALPAGCYFLKMTTAEGQSKLIKFINQD